MKKHTAGTNNTQFVNRKNFPQNVKNRMIALIVVKINAVASPATRKLLEYLAFYKHAHVEA